MNIIRKEFSSGAFGVIVAMKDYLNKGSNITTPSYIVDMYDEQYTVEVNKWKVVGAKTQAYTAWDTTASRFKTFFNHETIKVPDYEAYRTYFATGKIHNRDSKGMDNTFVSLAILAEWAIAIHDAGLVLPGSQFRRLFIVELNRQRSIKQQVVAHYSKSIGATTPAAALLYSKLIKVVQPLSEEVQFEESALK